ncbi:MAG TPA: hypothetical protein VJN18_12280 [Polyangiaceae bacterium]|nr:hypothetical protein [Polyangiaceae bacterium]
MKGAPAALVAAVAVLAVRSTAAQGLESKPTEAPPDRFELSAHAETYATFFRRALLPGPEGALVETEFAAPVYEYLHLSARNLDVAGQQDNVDLEVSGWARAWPTETRFEGPFDGDLQTAAVTYHRGPGTARLGRQQFVGGAARFARFDGLSLGARLGAGLSARAYGGLTVLPRYNERPGYYHLGSEADSLLRDPEAFEQPRRGHWLAGARLNYGSPRLSASASFHEQREQGELGHRNLGLDARGVLSPRASAAASAVLDADALRLSDSRLWLDLELLQPLSLSLEYLHTEPALWLSRQSVLSVFSTDRFDEAGGMATLRLSPKLRLEGSGFVSLYDDHRPGARSEGTLRVTPDALTVVRVSYVRVLAPSNGYHSLRSSLSRRLLAELSATLEAYAYLYDQPVRGFRASSVYAGTLSYEPKSRFSALWGASLSRTPYAALDAQTLLRLSYAFDHLPGGRK